MDIGRGIVQALIFVFCIGVFIPSCAIFIYTQIKVPTLERNKKIVPEVHIKTENINGKIHSDTTYIYK